MVTHGSPEMAGEEGFVAKLWWRGWGVFVGGRLRELGEPSPAIVLCPVSKFHLSFPCAIAPMHIFEDGL